MKPNNGIIYHIIACLRMNRRPTIRRLWIMRIIQAGSSIWILFFGWILHPSHLIAQETPAFEKGSVIVHLKPGYHPIDLQTASAPIIHSFESIQKTWNIWLLKADEADVPKLIQQLRNSPTVVVAQRNRRARPRQFIPDDPFFPQQWNLLNTGQSNGTAGMDVGITTVWNGGWRLTSPGGDSLVIAIVDGGLNINHPDLNVYVNRGEIAGNGIDDDGNGYIDDVHGWNAFQDNGTIFNDFHGTHVSGIAAAITNNALGISGIHGGIPIMPVVLRNYTEAEVIKGYGYIADQKRLYLQTNGQKGAFIVVANSSFGVDFGKPADYPIWCSLYDSLGALGILSVAATTNRFINVDEAGDIPTTCPSPFLITVTNANRLGNLAGAGYGTTHIDLGAPGSQIMSLNAAGGYQESTGASMAAPHVSAAVSLMYSRGCPLWNRYHPQNSDEFSLLIKNILLETVKETPAFKNRVKSGGILDIGAALPFFISEACDDCMKITPIVEPIRCNGRNEGVIHWIIRKGVPPYSYQWSDGNQQASRESLGAGRYAVTITDATACSKIYFLKLNQPDSLTWITSVNPALPTEKGNISITVAGGKPPYQFLWSDVNDPVSARFNLDPGNYQVVFVDDAGCIIRDSFVVENLTHQNLLIPQNNTWTVYPNPAQEILWIKNNFNLSKICYLRVWGLDGRQYHPWFTPQGENVWKVQLPLNIHGKAWIEVQSCDGAKHYFSIWMEHRHLAID